MPDLNDLRVLDAQVCEDVLGWQWVREPNTRNVFGWWMDGEEFRKDVLPVSTDIAAAWQVVLAMVARSSTTFGWMGPVFKPEHHYMTQEGFPLGTTCWYIHVTAFGWVKNFCAHHPCIAICRAALWVVEQERKEVK